MPEVRQLLFAALSPDKHGSEESWRSPTQDRVSPSQGVEVPASPDLNPVLKSGAHHPEIDDVDEARNAPRFTPEKMGLHTTEATPPFDHPSDWSPSDAAKWLTELKFVPEKGMGYIADNACDGEFLLTIVDAPHFEEVMEQDLGVRHKGQMYLLASKLKKLRRQATDAKERHAAAQTTSPDTRMEQSGYNGGPTPERKSRLAGAKSIPMPVYPTKTDASDYPLPLEYKTWIVSLKVWAGMDCLAYARALEVMYSNTDLAVDEEVYGMFDPTQRNVDSILGVHLFTTLPIGVMKHLIKSETYEIIPGKTSGMKILAFIGKRVNKRNAGRWLSVSNKLNDRKPLRHINELETELTEIDSLMDQCTHQGHDVDSKQLYMVLNKSLKKLLAQDGSGGKDYPSLQLVLATPVYACGKINPLDGHALFDLLKTIVEEIEDEEQWRHLKRDKKKPAGDESMGAEDTEEEKKTHNTSTAQDTEGRDKPPSGQIMRTPPGKPCPNERDAGKCYAEGKGCQGTHGHTYWTKTECTNPCYAKFSMCPNFFTNKKGEMCKGMHTKKPSGHDGIKAAKAKSKEEFPEMFASCQECNEMPSSDTSSSNIMPVGIKRSRKPSSRPLYINSMVAALIENEEEAEAMEQYDDTKDEPRDPLGSSQEDTDPDKTDDDSALSDLINGSDVSDQSAEWEPDEDDQADIELAEMLEAIDPSMMYMLDEGFQPCQIMAMEANRELLIQRLDAAAAVTAIPDNSKILVDGGTFAHMWGTGVHHMLYNRRKIPGKRIMTAGGESTVYEMADLSIGGYELLDGYVNDNMTTSLLCEGDLARNQGWQFLSAGDQKLCMTSQGNFVAERHGNLHFWPVEEEERIPGGTRIAQYPHQKNPVLPEHAKQIEQALQEMHPWHLDEEAFVSAYEQEWAEEDEESMFLGMYPDINADEEALADGCKATSPRPIAMAACTEPAVKITAEQELTSSYSAAVEWAAEINADHIMVAAPLCMQVTNKTEHKMLSDHLRSGHVSDLPNGMSCDSCTKGKRTNIPAFVNKMYPSADFDTAFMQSTMQDAHELTAEVPGLSSDTDH